MDFKEKIFEAYLNYRQINDEFHEIKSKLQTSTYILQQTFVSSYLKWAEERLKDYQEPSREGTPRGAEIGFSKKKLYAAILCNLHPILKLHEIAEMAEVSAGLLRQWRGDSRFFAKIDEKQNEFIEETALEHEIVESIKEICKWRW